MSKYNFYVEDVSVEAVFNKLGGVDGARRLLCDELTLVEVAPDLVRVDRTVRPTYPDWMREVLHSELEATGPSEFDYGKLTMWLHDRQKNGTVTGQVIYDHLKSGDMLSSCLGLRDLEEIQKKGITHFRKYFKGQAVFGWKSVVRLGDGLLDVPYLCESGGRVVLFWDWPGHDWDSSSPALRFA